MRPVIITATPNISWLNPSLRYPQSPDEFADEAKNVERAGASILHMHAQGMWGDAIREVRRKSSLIVQCGMSSLGIKDRMEVFTAGSDMISVILGHHDEAFVKQDFHVLHPREELLEYSKLFRKYGVRPEFEVWHTGHIWNLNYLIDKGALDVPYFTTLFFGWPGGNWTPPTVEEYLYRRSKMPPNSIINVSIMGKEQMKIMAAAVAAGDNVRVGTEDNPHMNGRPASNEELVGQAADLARSMGRRVARPDEAAKIIGLNGWK
ncbi:MAG: 3-keto-5-aminohexanoate cleavage protein [Nitrososphaerota archaeon]|jgi:3-keto-5-aminohexanoate cleavage enzyme|nr:3-keto-5-aminohexanoate cleavage protein [Nitrososphaerota archaeon]MDG6935591.1 3-keto-5-aminohexanoate cleavage protein [Nitrososphaerota archaeon]MDG6944035.1 3-keto-5-aminohexanoate cleavage protein [Nitrososphaerota archaeon]